MPWTANDSDGRHLTAPDFSGAEWRALRRSYHDRGLTMTCCGAPAIPRTSPLGTPYFAHAPNVANCGWDREPAEMSERHQALQLMFRKIIRQLGWSAEIEVSGRTPSGERWRADVWAVKGCIQAAVEVQLAHQTSTETVRRTSKYAESGVACLWLFDGPPTDLEKVRASQMHDRRQVVFYPVTLQTAHLTEVIRNFLISVERIHLAEGERLRVEREVQAEICRERAEIAPLFEDRLSEIQRMCDARRLEVNDAEESIPVRREDADGWMWQVVFSIHDRGGNELHFSLCHYHDLGSWSLALDGAMHRYYFDDGEMLPTFVIPNAFYSYRRGDL